MVKDCVGPLQVLTGRTVTVAVTAVVPLLMAVKLPMFPMPLPAKPMLLLLLVQVKLVPANVLLNVKGPTVCPAQTTTLAGTVTSGAGFTVMVLEMVIGPHSELISTEILKTPGDRNCIGPGFWSDEVEGVPPFIVQLYVS